MSDERPKLNPDALDDLYEALEACIFVVGAYETEHMSNWALDAHSKASAALRKARGEMQAIYNGERDG